MSSFLSCEWTHLRRCERSLPNGRCTLRLAIVTRSSSPLLLAWGALPEPNRVHGSIRSPSMRRAPTRPAAPGLGVFAMPYITPSQRNALDDAIRELARGIADLSRTMPEETAFAGLLNYACTSLAIQVVEARFGRLRYGTVATVTGVFKNIADAVY